MKTNEQAPTIYVAAEVEAVQQLFNRQLARRYSYVTVKSYLQELAAHLWQAFKRRDERTAILFRNYYPGLSTSGTEAILNQPFADANAYLCIAREYGYVNWAAVPESPLDFTFERALDALLSGDENSLQRLLDAQPDLSTQRSVFGHGATLLHYLAANGVELWRQQVPHNAPALATLLLERGSDANASCTVYGGEFNTMALLNSSAHPENAGIAATLREVLS